MKRFLIKIVIFGAFCFLISVVFPYWLDPYNVFHIENTRNNGVEPNNNYIKVSYLINHPADYDCLIFGSSRVGGINAKNIPNYSCYNMTYSEGVPIEHYNNLHTLINNGVMPKRIYVGVDSISYTCDSVIHKGQLIRMPYEVLTDEPYKIYKTYINSGVAFQSLPIILEHRISTRNTITNVYETEESLVDDGNVPAVIGNGYDIEGCIEAISNIKKLCTDNNIEAIFFTNPMFQATYKASVDYNYYLFLKELSKVTGFYNFSGINDVTVNAKNYFDASHYKISVGDIMIEAMCKGQVDDSLLNQGFGMYVDRSNIDDLLRILRQKEVQ